jgi:hypothetical protein
MEEIAGLSIGDWHLLRHDRILRVGGRDGERGSTRGTAGEGCVYSLQLTVFSWLYAVHRTHPLGRGILVRELPRGAGTIEVIESEGVMANVAARGEQLMKGAHTLNPEP